MSAKPEFVYVTYIASDPESVWNALIDAKTTPKYWQKANVSDWKPGSRWEHRKPGEEGPPLIVGRVVEFIPPRRLVLTWTFPEDEAREERRSRVTFKIEPLGEAVRLIVTHDRLEPGSNMQRGITDGWPRVLSSLKSYLETGIPLPEPILNPAATPLGPSAADGSKYETHAPKRIMESLFRKVDCVGIRVTSLEEAIDFYVNRLGHPLNWRSKTAAGLEIPESETELVLHTEPWALETGLLVASVPEAVRRFTGAGGRLIEGPLETQIGLLALLADRWENRIMILDLSKGMLEVDPEKNVIRRD